MKKALFLSLIAWCLAVQLYGQGAGSYNNEWINFNKTYYKIKVAKNGLYRIPYDLLVQYGISTNAPDLKLYYQGQEVPLFTSSNAAMSSGDFVEFYGQKNDGRFDTQLYKNPNWQPTSEYSLFSDTAVYYLTASSETGNLRHQNLANNLSGTLPDKELYYRHNETIIYPNAFFPGEPFHNLGGVNNYYSDFDNCEGFVGEVIVEDTSKTYNLSVPSLYSAAGGTVFFETKVTGRSDDYFAIPDHHTLIEVAGLSKDTLYEGYTNYKFKFNIPVADIVGNTIPVTYTVLSDVSSADKISVVYNRLSYNRGFNFNNQAIQKFEVANGNRYFEVTNFNGGTNPVLYDLSNNFRLLPQLQVIGGQSVYRFFIPNVADGPATRTLLLASTNNPNSVRTVTSLDVRQFTDFSQPANQGNYLIVTHPWLMEGDTNYVAKYADYRHSMQGGNYSVVVANIEELYDQFSYGIAKHPLAIRNFINYGIAHWGIKPEYMLLLGKSVMYNKNRFNPTEYANCLVPSYGSSPSDISLSAPNTTIYFPQLATGRVSARTPAMVRNYLQKIMEYEQPPTCDKETMVWRKNALHLAGGHSITEAQDFFDYVEGYRHIYEDTMFAGSVVHTYQNAQPDPIAAAPELGQYINNGLNAINFVGHSSGYIWIVDLGKPDDYTNTGKYPFVFSSSCFVGNLHESYVPNPGLPPYTPASMAEEWTLFPELGAIGFLASVSFGFPPYMDLYMTELYKNICRDDFGKPVGYCIKKAIADADSAALLPSFPFGYDGVKLTAQEYTLAGDPAIKLSVLDKPELAIEYQEGGNTDITLTPTNITTNLDSFAVNVHISNLGPVTFDSLTVRIDRTFPDGTTALAASKRIPVMNYEQTVTLYVITGAPEKVAGDNYLTVRVDADNDIDEFCEENNTVTLQTFIFSNLLAPISPCNYSIVTAQPVTLRAATGTPLGETLPYTIEIDTSKLFNSPLKAAYALYSTGGLIEWLLPSNLLIPNKVYYWRTGQIQPGSPNTNSYNWQYSSFIYLPGGEKGWNQSHYYQFLNDGYQDIYMDSTTRTFKFKSVENTLNISNSQQYFDAIVGTFDVTQVISLSTCLKQPCQNGGLVFAVFRPYYNPITQKMETQLLNSIQQFPSSTVDICDRRGTYGNFQCSLGDVSAFEFGTTTVEQLNNMANFIGNVIQPGDYVLVYSAYRHHLQITNPNNPINNYLPTLAQFFSDLGVPQASSVPNDRSFLAFGQYQTGQYPPEFVMSTDSLQTIELSAEFKMRMANGTLLSPPIGPSLQWGRMVWEHNGTEAGGPDVAMVDLIGVKPDGSEETLIPNVQSTETDLSSINPTNYPFLRLRETVEDTLYRTPAQLQHWRVHYKQAGELAIDPPKHFVFYNDTIREGENIHLELAVVNASSTNMDSVLIQYSVLNLDNNTLNVLPYPRQAPVNAFQTLISNFTYSSVGMTGHNVLLIDVNPNGDQPEKFRFNNALQIPFYVISDKVNPILDVTFDGRHILNGDIVSAKPTILVRLKDESAYLALNDTSDISLHFIYPNGSQVPVYFNNPAVTFIPATDSDAQNGKNEARVEINPEFLQDGDYELIATANDRSNNPFAAEPYRIAFKVITQSMVSNVVNYPNPFTTNTKFVFTLTGSELPDFFNIQIMTVSGRVVRELGQAELGTLFIGRNITQYAWDGTDQFGKPLANGLYLYRVVAKINGKTLDHYNTEQIDGMFNNGIGKMYLMR